MCAPFCSCAALLAQLHSLPLPLHVALPLAHGPSPCVHPPWSLLHPWHAHKGERCVGRVGCINQGGWHSQAGGDLGWVHYPSCAPWHAGEDGRWGEAGQVNQGAQQGQPHKWDDLHKGEGEQMGVLQKWWGPAHICTSCLCGKVR